MLYVIIKRGDTPETARPVLATADPSIVRAVAKALQEQLAKASREADAPALRLLKRAAEGDAHNTHRAKPVATPVEGEEER